MKPAAVHMAIWMTVISLGVIACRGTDPSGDPKTPPNSPLPDIERPEEPKGPLPSPVGDGGVTSSSADPTP